MMKVLIPLDGTDCSKAALTWVIGNCKPEETACYLLHVIKLMAELPWALEENAIGLPYYEADAQAILQEACHVLQQAGFTVSETESRTGDPASEICRYANDKQVEQVVIASHERNRIGKFLHGSISEEVLEYCSSASVLVVPCH